MHRKILPVWKRFWSKVYLAASPFYIFFSFFLMHDSRSDAWLGSQVSLPTNTAHLISISISISISTTHKGVSKTFFRSLRIVPRSSFRPSSRPPVRRFSLSFYFLPCTRQALQIGTCRDLARLPSPSRASPSRSCSSRRTSAAAR